MTRLFFICLLAVALQSGSCQQPTQLTESQRAVIRDSVTQMNNRFYDEMRAHHVEASIDFLDNSPEFFWVYLPDTTVLSHDAFAAVFKVGFQLYRSYDAMVDYMRVEPLTNQYAVYTTRYRYTAIDTSGKVFKFTGIETGIVVHRSSGWKFLNGQTFEVPLKNE